MYADVVDAVERPAMPVRTTFIGSVLGGVNAGRHVGRE